MTNPGAGQRAWSARALQEHHEGWAPDQPLPAEPPLLAGQPGPPLATGEPGGPVTPADTGRGTPIVRENDELWATASYAAALVTWLFAPLAIYLIWGRRSAFVRRHAAQALRLTLTVTLFAVSGGIVYALLTLDSTEYALLIMGPVLFVFWLVSLWYLIRAARAARRGDFYAVPGWICVRVRG